MYTVRESDFRHAPVPSDMNADWARYPRLNITWDILNKQTATRKRSSNEQLYRPEVTRIRCVNNCRVESSLVTNQQRLSSFNSCTLWFLSYCIFFERSLSRRSSLIAVCFWNTKCKCCIYEWFRYIAKPGFQYITMTPGFVITVINMLKKTAHSLLVVP